MKHGRLKSIVWFSILFLGILFITNLTVYPVRPIKESFAISMTNQIGSYSYIGTGYANFSYPLFYGINQGYYVGIPILPNIPSNVITQLNSYFNTYPVTTRTNITTYTTSKIISFSAYFLEVNKGFTAYSYGASYNSAGQLLYTRSDTATAQGTPPDARTKVGVWLPLNFYIIIVPIGFPQPPATITITTSDTSAYTGDYQDDILTIKRNCNRANIPSQPLFDVSESAANAPPEEELATRYTPGKKGNCVRACNTFCKQDEDNLNEYV